MTVIPAQQVTLSIPTPGASYQVDAIGGGVFTDFGVTDEAGVATPATPYPIGQYQVFWTYQSVTRTDHMVVTLNQRIYGFRPLNLTDPDIGDEADPTNALVAPSGVNPTGIQQLPESLPNPTLASIGTVASPDTDPSVSWPQYNYGKYFTPTQAFMYIGDVFIDELNGFQYTLQGNKIPVFGYSSYRMDAVGTGKSLVQGQLTINFISEGYLYTVLNDYKTRSSGPRPEDERAALNLVEQYTVLVSNGAATSASGRVQMADVRVKLNKLLANNSNLPSVIANAKKSAQPTGINPVYSRTPFDIVFQFEGGGRTITRRINKCVLTSNEQILGDGDSIVLEAYGFIARDIS